MYIIIYNMYILYIHTTYIYQKGFHFISKSAETMWILHRETQSEGRREGYMSRIWEPQKFGNMSNKSENLSSLTICHLFGGLDSETSMQSTFAVKPRKSVFPDRHPAMSHRMGTNGPWTVGQLVSRVCQSCHEGHEATTASCYWCYCMWLPRIWCLGHLQHPKVKLLVSRAFLPLLGPLVPQDGRKLWV